MGVISEMDIYVRNHDLAGDIPGCVFLFSIVWSVENSHTNDFTRWSIMLYQQCN